MLCERCLAMAFAFRKPSTACQITDFNLSGLGAHSGAVSGRCPLYHRKRTSIEGVEMSALCQKRTSRCFNQSPRQHNGTSTQAPSRSVRLSAVALTATAIGTSLLSPLCPPPTLAPAGSCSPNAAPFDATCWPFSDTALVSQAWGHSELVPHIHPQIREIASADSDPQT